MLLTVLNVKDGAITHTAINTRTDTATDDFNIIIIFGLMRSTTYNDGTDAD